MYSEDGAKPEEMVAYYHRHPEVPWYVKESPNYEIDLPDVSPNTCALGEPDHPCIFKIDELEFDNRHYTDLLVLNCHGGIKNGVWLAKCRNGRIDVIDLVREIFNKGHKLDMIIICSTGDLSRPPEEYFFFLNQAQIVYAKPSEGVDVVLRIDMHGKVIGKVTGERYPEAQGFANTESLGKSKTT